MGLYNRHFPLAVVSDLIGREGGRVTEPLAARRAEAMIEPAAFIRHMPVCDKAALVDQSEV